MGLITPSGDILARVVQPTPHHLSGQAILEAISDKLGRLIAYASENSQHIIGIGVSVCGYLTPSGDEPDYINLHSLDHFPIAKLFKDQYNLPVVMDNDMNCGVLGEYYFGDYAKERRLMAMTVGTGVGMAVMFDGKVVRLHAGTIGNPGHIIVSPNGPLCSAGCRGCLESVASAGAIIRLAVDMAHSQRSPILKEMLCKYGELTPKLVFQAAEAGDEGAWEIWHVVGAWLGKGLASWVEIFGPRIVVVGGGVSEAGHWLIDTIESEMRKVGEPYFTRNVRAVKQSRLGADIAMLGAATLFLFPENAPSYEKDDKAW